MVARVALLAEDTTFPSDSVHLSGLQFHPHSTHQTINTETIEINSSVDVDEISAAKGQAIEEKVQ